MAEFKQGNDISFLERSLLFYIDKEEGISSRRFLQNFTKTRSFFSGVLEHMKNANLIRMSGTILHVPRENLDDKSIERREARFLEKKIPFIDIKKLNELYSHSMDLYVLNYYQDAIQNALLIFYEITRALDTRPESFFYPLDWKFFAFIDKHFEEINFENESLAGEIFLDIIQLYVQDLELFMDIMRMREFYSKQENLFRELNEIMSAERNNTQDHLENLLALYLFHFHPKIGPRVFFSKTTGKEDNIRAALQKQMDIFNPNPFCLSVGNYHSINYQFHVPSPLARGKKEYLQLSLVFDKEMPDVKPIETIIFRFCEKMMELKDLYKILYINKEINQISGDQEISSLKNDFMTIVRDTIPYEQQ